MAYKRYQSVFSGSSNLSENKKFKVKQRIRNILREKSLSPKDVESIVGKIESVITDVISGYGVDNSIVDELSGTVKNINAFASTMAVQNETAEDIQTMEESFRRKNRKLKENYMDMNYNSGLEVDPFEDEMIDASFDQEDEMMMADEYSMYENRLSKINKLKKKLREGLDEAEDMDEGEDMDEADEMDEDIEEAEDMDEGEDMDEEDMDEADEMDEEDMDEADMSAYDEEDEEEEKKEKKESKRFRNFKYSEESEHGEGLIPSEEGSDYDFLDGIDDMGNSPSERSMIAKYDSKKGM